MAVHGSESRVKAGEVVWQYTVERESCEGR